MNDIGYFKTLDDGNFGHLKISNHEREIACFYRPDLLGISGGKANMTIKLNELNLPGVDTDAISLLFKKYMSDYFYLSAPEDYLNPKLDIIYDSLINFIKYLDPKGLYGYFTWIKFYGREKSHYFNGIVTKEEISYFLEKRATETPMLLVPEEKEYIQTFYITKADIQKIINWILYELRKEYYLKSSSFCGYLVQIMEQYKSHRKSIKKCVANIGSPEKSCEFYVALYGSDKFMYKLSPGEWKIFFNYLDISELFTQPDKTPIAEAIYKTIMAGDSINYFSRENLWILGEKYFIFGDTLYDHKQIIINTFQKSEESWNFSLCYVGYTARNYKAIRENTESIKTQPVIIKKELALYEYSIWELL